MNINANARNMKLLDRRRETVTQSNLLSKMALSLKHLPQESLKLLIQVIIRKAVRVAINNLKPT